MYFKIMSATNRLNNRVQPDDRIIEFWLGQFVEHALFLARLLDPNVVPELKQEAHELFLRLNEVVRANRADQGTRLLISLYALLLTIHNKQKEIPNLNLEIPADDFHDLLNHMLLEQTYFVRLTSNKMTIKEELAFYAQESAEHLTLVANLLPEGELKQSLQQIADQLNNLRVQGVENPLVLSQVAQVLEIEPSYTAQVNEAVLRGEVAIDKDMLAHEIRESTIGLERVRFFVNYLQ